MDLDRRDAWDDAFNCDMTFERDSLGLDGQVGSSVLLGDVDNYISNQFLRVFRGLFLLEDIAVDIEGSVKQLVKVCRLSCLRIKTIVHSPECFTD